MAYDVRLQRDFTRLVVGVAIILAGILFTLDNLHLIDAGNYLAYWPLVLVAIGITRMTQTTTWGSFGWSLVWIVAGFWLLGQNVGLITVSIFTLWPLVLVLIGATIAWRGFGPPRLRSTAYPRCCGTSETTPLDGAAMPGSGASSLPGDSYVRAVAVMGGIERSSNSADFQGADLVAIMGGCELDLRHATIAGDEAVVDVVSIMGGIEIYVPTTWAIEARVMPLLGGLGDETRLNTSGPTKRLVVRGIALMGGVEIKN